MKTRIVQTTPLFSTEDWDNEPTSPMPLLSVPGHFPLANSLLIWHDMGHGDHLVEYLGLWDWSRTEADTIPSIFE